MIVTTISKDRINSVSLPQKAAGQYWLYDDLTKSSERLASIEGLNDEWILKSNRKVKLLDSKGASIKNTIISPLSIYVLAKADGERTFVFTEPATEDRQVFTKYLTTHDITLSIGRSEQNDICFDNKVVSGRHASLSYRGGRWFLQDEKSTNGTFVNQKRINSVELSCGDTIFIMGLKIIIGKSFIAINNPDGKVRVTNSLNRFIPQTVQSVDEEDEYELSEPSYFYRSPRFKRDVETATFKIDSPPTSPII